MSWWNKLVQRVRVLVAQLNFLRPATSRRELAAFVRSMAAQWKVLDPEGNGRRDAQENQPPLRGDGRGKWEREAIVGFQNTLDNEKKRIRRLLEGCAARVRLLPSPPPLDPDHIAAQVEAQLSGIKDRYKTRLTDARYSLRQNAIDLRAFQHEHVLRREASPPNRVLAATLILAVVMLELFLNYNMLWRQGAGSASSVFGIILVPAVVATSIGLCTGFFGIRNILHKQSRRRAIGWLITILGVFAILFLHSMFATYRMSLSEVNAIQGLTDEARELARAESFRRLLFITIENPFSFFQDFSAFTYFIFSLMFSSISIVEGVLLLSDKYPGYLQVYLEHQKARAHDAAERSRFEMAVKSAFATGLSAADAVTAASKSHRDGIKLEIDQSATYIKDYQAAAVKANELMSRMVQKYREVNVEIRGGAAPSHFRTDRPTLSLELDYDIESLKIEQDKAFNSHSSLSTRAEQLKARLLKMQSSYQSAVVEYLEQIERDTNAADVAAARAFGVREAQL